MIETIKKHKALLIVAAALIIAAVSFAAGMSVKDSSADTTDEHFIGIEKARQIAFADAGVKEKDVHVTDADLEREDGARSYYDIEFNRGNTSFDYKIDAASGEIFDKSKEQTGKKAGTDGSGKPEETASLNSYIGVEKAKSIALKYAGVSAGAAHFTSAHLDTENGVKIYELEFTAGNRSYEFDINAYTGAILDSDSEYIGGGSRDDWDDDWDDDDDRDDDDDDRDDDDHDDGDDDD